VTGVRKLVLVVALIGIMVTIYGLSVALNYERYAGDIEEELTYFPSGRFLQIASLGYRTLASDLLWLKGIQYYGEHRRNDRYYPLAEHIYSTITDLDPQFLGAYRFGAFVLAQDMGQPAAGIQLLKKGMVSNPGEWQLPFDLGFLYFTSADDDVKAGHYFKMASRFDESPDIAKRFSAFAYRRAGRTNLSLSLWEEIYRSSSNSVIRESALYSINCIRLEQMRDVLAELVERFRSQTGRFPSGLRELVEMGLVEMVPDDPFGGTYFFDGVSQTVLSTTEVRQDAGRAKRYLERKLGQYLDKMGCFPDSIQVLESEGFIDDVPPVVAACMHYHPAEGKVHYVFPWEDSE
jgi:tetratricopeptide (TPR) repeat protein